MEFSKEEIEFLLHCIRSSERIHGGYLFVATELVQKLMKEYSKEVGSIDKPNNRSDTLKFGDIGK